MTLGEKKRRRMCDGGDRDINPTSAFQPCRLARSAVQDTGRNAIGGESCGVCRAESFGQTRAVPEAEASAPQAVVKSTSLKQKLGLLKDAPSTKLALEWPHALDSGSFLVLLACRTLLSSAS